MTNHFDPWTTLTRWYSMFFEHRFRGIQWNSDCSEPRHLAEPKERFKLSSWYIFSMRILTSLSTDSSLAVAPSLVCVCFLPTDVMSPSSSALPVALPEPLSEITETEVHDCTDWKRQGIGVQWLGMRRELCEKLAWGMGANQTWAWEKQSHRHRREEEDRPAKGRHRVR